MESLTPEAIEMAIDVLVFALVSWLTLGSAALLEEASDYFFAHDIPVLPALFDALARALRGINATPRRP